MADGKKASSLPLYAGIICLVLAAAGLVAPKVVPKVVPLVRQYLPSRSHTPPPRPAPASVPAKPISLPPLPVRPAAAATASPSEPAAEPARAPGSPAAGAAPGVAAGQVQGAAPVPGAGEQDTLVRAQPVRLTPPHRTSAQQAEHRRLLTEQVLARVAGVTDTLSLGWFGSHFEQVSDTTRLQAYLAEVLALGRSRVPVPVTDSAAARQLVRRPHTGEPARRMREAKEQIYSGRPSRRGLAGKARGSLAAALYLEQDESGGLQHADPGFVARFFKEQAVLFGQLGELPARGKVDTTAWASEQVRALEAGALDGYLRLQRLEEQIRLRLGGVPVGLAPGSARPEALQKALDQQLLQVGLIRLKEAEGEVVDLERMQHDAQVAFDILALVYRRSSPSKALQGLVRISELEANGLREMARSSRRLAAEAATAGDTVAAAEYYFRATQHYNECLARAAGDEREELVAEFLRVKQELAAWYGRDRSPAAARRPGL